MYLNFISILKVEILLNVFVIITKITQPKKAEKKSKLRLYTSKYYMKIYIVQK